MKILNISSIIPLKGLQRENDIVLRLQDYLTKEYNYQFTIAKSLTYVPPFLAWLSNKWTLYRKYQGKGEIEVQGYNTFIYSWIIPPISNFWINYFLTPFNWVWYKVFVEKRFAQITNESELIVTQNIIRDGVLAYWLHIKYGKPYILNIRGVVKKHWLKLPFIRAIIKNASFIATPSPTLFKELKDDYNIHLIPHPVDEKFYGKSEKLFNKPNIISICRLLDWKQIDLVIETLVDLSWKGYDFNYKIIGDGPEENKLKKLAKKLSIQDSIQFEGFVKHNQIPKYLKEADIFIQPSYPETLGRVFLEAAASGCLIVGHKNTGVDGIFKEDESAFFVDKNSIKERMVYILDNYSSTFFDSYISKSKNISEQFRWKKIGKRYDDLYRDILVNK